MNLAIDLVSWVCLSVGAVFAVIGTVGLVRMPSFFTRMHAASVTDTLGAGLVLLGMLLQAGFSLVALKLAVLGILILFASPTAAHALAKAALARGVDLLQIRSDSSNR